MISHSAVPLLAAGIGDFVPVIFLIVMIISWIANLIKENAKPAPPPGRRPRPRGGDKLQNEIELFLKDVGGKKPASKATEIEVFESPPPRRQKYEPPRRRKPPMPQEQPQRETEHLSEHHLETSKGLGSGIDTHVSEHLKRKKKKKWQLPTNIQTSVTDHLGAGQKRYTSDAEALPKRKKSPAAGLLESLRRPQGVRDAIIFSEILRKPRILERRQTKSS